MPVDSKAQALLQRQRSVRYLNKDFDGFKADLFDFARTFFPDSIKDLSEPGVAGMFLDLAAYVGDVSNFYLDHQFHELDPETSVESRNIERHLKRAGVQITGASPAVCDITWFIKVPADTTVTPPEPLRTALPTIQAPTVARAENGTLFELVEDLDFAERDKLGRLKASVVVGEKSSDNTPQTFILSRNGVGISGTRNVETFGVGAFVPFARYSLSRDNVTEVLSVRDSTGVEYYEVESLAEDVVFKRILNRNNDNELVKDLMILQPAPYRFTKDMDLGSRLTTLTFGGGSAMSLDNDAIPDPSEFALPLYGKRTFGRFAINPGNLLQSNTLGTLTPDTSLTVTYRHGGGLSHNIPDDTIRGVQTLFLTFPYGPSPSVSQFVRASVDARNLKRAGGGDDAPTMEELKGRISGERSAQKRIVTKPDLLSRVYLMPSNFGRVFRAAVRPNPNNPLSSQLFIVSRDQDQRLVLSPDSLKKNLQTYLSQFTLISDALDILDARVINLQVQFSIVTDPEVPGNLVVQTVLKRLKDYFNIKHFDIDQPLILSDLQNLIFNNQGVISVDSVRVKNLSGAVNGRAYSDVRFDVDSNTVKGILFPPPGGMFEIRFKDHDLVGSTV